MVNRKQKIWFFLLLLIILGPIISNVVNQNLQKRKSINPKCSQSSENIPVQSTFSKLIWIEGELTISITPNSSGNVRIIFREITEENSFSEIRETHNITVINETNTFQFLISPKWLTLPGEYIFNLTVTFSNSENNEIFVYNESFETILGMGYLTMIIFFSALIIALITVIIKTKKPTKQATTSIESPAEEEYVETTGPAPAGKIKCPNCYKIIKEGLTFCPECGSRIPEYLRNNPNT
jgi:Na+-transporting methylmalonyl-CoA/oxaloacetate decarboxylase gamma subunit